MYSDELYHYGVKGQKWGVRRYQNSDGSYTDEGKRRYGRGSGTGRRVGKKKRYSKEDLKEDLKYDAIASLIGPYTATSYRIANNSKKYRAGAYKTLADGRIAPNGRVTKVTRGVIDDYNNMDEKAFRGKYAASKSTYLKRLSKYDDPYKHAKNSSWYKAAKKISKPMLERRANIRKSLNWTKGDDWQEPGAQRIGGRGTMILGRRVDLNEQLGLEPHSIKPNKYTYTPNRVFNGDGTVNATKYRRFVTGLTGATGAVNGAIAGYGAGHRASRGNKKAALAGAVAGGVLGGASGALGGNLFARGGQRLNAKLMRNTTKNGRSQAAYRDDNGTLMTEEYYRNRKLRR